MRIPKTIGALAFVGLAFGGQPAIATSGSVIFRNVGRHYLYVAIVANCTDGFAKVDHIVSLDVGQSTTIPAAGSLCYGYSALPLPQLGLWGVGQANPGDTVEIPGSSPLLRVKSADQRTGADEPESMVFVGASAPERAKTFARAIPGLARTWGLTPADQATIERSLASWLDHTSRQSATECVQEAVIEIPFDGEIRTCTGWATRWRCPRNEAVLVVRTLDVSRANQAITNCVGTAAAVGAIAAISSGGAAAVPAAEAAFAVCLGDAVVDSDIEIRGGWTQWGGC